MLGKQAVRFEHWKAIREPMFTGKIQLYDLAKDVSEKNNVASENPQIVERAIVYLNKAHTPDPNWQVKSQ